MDILVTGVTVTLQWKLQFSAAFRLHAAAVTRFRRGSVGVEEEGVFGSEGSEKTLRNLVLN